MTPTAERKLALGLAFAGSLMVLMTAQMPWVELPPPEFVEVFETRSGIDERPGLGQLPWACLGTLVAVVATRGFARVLAGVLLIVLGGACGGLVVDWLGDADGPGSTARGAPVMTLVGAGLVVAGGLLIAVRGRRWPGLGSSYGAPGGASRGKPVTDKAVWDALDRGDDPTA